MSGKDAIIEKIISDADNRASAIISEAEEKARNNEKEALKEAEEAMKKAEESYSSIVSEAVEKKKAIAEADVKKYRLALKQEVLGEVYSRAERKLKELGDEKYLAFIKKLFEESAEGGEEVVIASSDEKRVTQSFLDKELPQLKLKITGKGDFEGGFVLTCDKYDKTVTFGNLMRQYREETEAEIAAYLFGEAL